HGRAQVAYPHPELEPILKPTYGVILYQEQVMQIAQVLAGYSLGGADLLRRAMGKKKPEEMAKQGEIFRKGAVERGVEEETARYIFDLMEKFAGYGFNKSHSAAYALVSYQTMWLKAHYPAPFMAAVCSADMDNTDKVVPLIDECRRMKLKVEPPQVNLSEYKFTAVDDKTVVYGLGAIKGVGESAIESIIHERNTNGPYDDIFGFCRRIDLRKVNRRVLESLVRAGALDGLGKNRATLMQQLPLALKLAEQHNAMQEVGQNDLFGMGDPQPTEASHAQVIPDDIEEWEEQQRLTAEKETLGLYLTGHPIDRYADELGKVTSSRIGDLSLDSNGAPGQRRRGVPVVVAGLVVTATHRQTQRGRMGTVLLDDRSGRIECTLFNDTYETHRELVSADKILVVSGGLSYDEFRGGLSIRIDNVLTFEQARAHYAGLLNVRVKLNGLDASGFREQLQHILSPFRGGTTGIRLHYQTAQASGDILLGQEWRVNPTDELLRRLEKLTGADSVKVDYRKRAS
ncbi:MAG: DNA polymerase III subunit alpha, partial [Candidatus Thiodiazotropha sp. (ex Myrtea spinifera)]|nr:DNA polymerase III subunit alpha [Candidatus Thiodiazotropha sp. (ex Myrtea spinifera)]